MSDVHTASLVDSDRPSARPHPAVLRVVYPPEVTWDHRLTGEPLTLGRQPDDGSPALAHATVSRRHAQVWWDVRGHHAVRDVGSRHGTLVGTTPVGQTPRVLNDGELLRLGDIILVYELVDDDDDPAVDRDLLPGAAPAIARLRAQVGRAAGDPSPVLIVGDTGTGKEWVARELHRLGGRSGRSGPMVSVNCATLTPQLVESQLFGHVRGAFTGATSDSDGLFRQASGGTLFLDEIGELPLDLQPKLLRVVQDGLVQAIGSSRTHQVDVRLCAATNRDLTGAVEDGGFRRDLYARLSKWELHVPSLAARRGDLLDWVERLWRLWHEERERACAPLSLTPGAAHRVLSHAWLDNLRGVDRLVHDLASRGTCAVDVADLPRWIDVRPPDGTTPGPAPAPVPPAPRPPVPSRDEFVRVWNELGGSVRAVAKHFCRDRRQTYRWLDAHGLRGDGDGGGEAGG